MSRKKQVLNYWVIRHTDNQNLYWSTYCENFDSRTITEGWHREKSFRLKFSEISEARDVINDLQRKKIKCTLVRVSARARAAPPLGTIYCFTSNLKRPFMVVKGPTTHEVWWRSVDDEGPRCYGTVEEWWIEVANRILVVMYNPEEDASDAGQ